MDSLTEINRQLKPIFESHNILRAIVFGSFARRDVTKYSDLDLIVIQNTNKHFLDRYDVLLTEITAAIQPRTVDLLIYTPEELDSLAGRPFIGTAIKEGKVIYESS